MDKFFKKLIKNYFNSVAFATPAPNSIFFSIKNQLKRGGRGIEKNNEKDNVREKGKGKESGKDNGREKHKDKNKNRVLPYPRPEPQGQLREKSTAAEPSIGTQNNRETNTKIDFASATNSND